MLGYIVRRLVAAALVLLATSMVVFAVFFYGPSDPAEAMCPETRCTQERLDNITRSLGLDRPVVEQYGEYMQGIFVGRQVKAGSLSIDCDAPCLGVSFKQRLDVADLLLSRFPATLSLAVGAAAVFLTIGLSVGIFAARRRGTLTDRLVVGASLVLSAIPYYLVVLLAYLYLVSQWGIFGETRYVGLTEVGFFAWANALLLPWIVLGLVYSTSYARFSRGSMVEALSEDYVRTARAKGLKSGTVVRRHALRAAIVPVVTIFGLDFAGLLAGTIFTEKIFGIRGIGLTALDAIQNSDLPIISATVLIAAFFVVVANILVDILYAIIDPRVRLS
jgi:peptide/nickel transport system permease protein